MKSGFILIDKPSGMTSHDVVSRLRKITGIKKIGHAGTLDPMATGLLVVAIGRESTKKISQYVKLDKVYEAEITLGSETDTYDAEGVITEVSKNVPEQERVHEVVNSFLGKQQQVPPMFSAKKIKGKKLYDLARRGEVIERQPVDIEVFSINVMSYGYPVINITVHVSSGTYIRSIAHDIGERLGVGGYLSMLRRTRIGEFDISSAMILDDLTSDNWSSYLFE